MKPKKNNQPVRIFVFLALMVSVILSPDTARALAGQFAPPPVDMFQLPWEQGASWVAFDGFDNGTRRSETSPHYFKLGGAVDFAPHANMVIGESTANAWVTAAAAGTVTTVTSCYIIIDHGNGWTTEYWHLANIQVVNAQKVYRNQRLGVIADNVTQQVCPGNEHPGPHLHFVMRPSMKDTVFSGWTINYNVITNLTTFTKNGQTVNRDQPILNIPNLQIVLREPIVWDTLYTGSIDPYRYERWPLQLPAQTKFDVTVAPTATGLIPVILLLRSDGSEIMRANGTLSTTQPAGSYFIQIKPDAGSGFYTLIAHRDVGTATPTSTGTLVPTNTPTPTSTSTNTPVVTNTFTPTNTFTNTPTRTNTPVVTNTFTPTGTLVPTNTFTNTPTRTNTPVVTNTFTPTGTLVPTNTFTNTPTRTNTPIVTNTFTATNTAVITQTTVVTNTPTSTNTAVITNTPVINGPYVQTTANPLTLNVGSTGLVTVTLNNIPVNGYTGTEFTCTYNPSLAEVSNIVVAGLFGPDPVSGVNGPQGGTFIVAIAGSNGRRALGGGAAFTFNVRGLQVGQMVVQCTARTSDGTNVLTSILSIPGNLTIVGNAPTVTPIPTSTTLTGQVLASKPVTITLYRQDNSIAASVIANPNGTFSLTAPGGTYTVVASASGFLNAQGPVTLVNGVPATKPTVSLPAGDIDNNGVINQLDALTIGINYNGTAPAAADLNNDGVINVLDLGLLAQNYLKSGALAW
ncbi:MAG: peptidoglycan DD-metalloendopeptidase family protein [Chloroflexi bacterium]|nr:peptidoglycan DD-metalloendopeptidase family protein [Chloroflexota bacterium]